MCSVSESIGEAGNLKAETLRILMKNEICVEEYQPRMHDQSQDDNKSSNYEPIFESLKVFTNNIDPETKEWIIP